MSIPKMDLESRTAKATESIVTEIAELRKEIEKSKMPQWYQWLLLLLTAVAAGASLAAVL